MIDAVTGATTWVIRPVAGGPVVRGRAGGFVNPLEGLQLQGNGTDEGRARARASTAWHREGRLAGVPTLSAIWRRSTRSAGSAASSSRPTGTVWPSASARTPHRPLASRLPAYNYFNFGAGFVIPNSGTRVNVDLLNAFQSKGLEEGNPRLCRPAARRSSWPGPSCRAGCRCRSAMTSEAAPRHSRSDVRRISSASSRRPQSEPPRRCRRRSRRTTAASCCRPTIPPGPRRRSSATGASGW